MKEIRKKGKKKDSDEKRKRKVMIDRIEKVKKGQNNGEVEHITGITF